jgi:hypothetical protein
VRQESTNRSFDDLARGLASGSVTRRRALRLMGGVLVGGTLASLGIGGVAGADPPGCKRNGKHCKRDKLCCSGECSSSGTCVGGVGCLPGCDDCTDHFQCCSGLCELPEGVCGSCL